MATQINFYDPALRLRRDWLALDVLAGAAAVLVLAVALGHGLLKREVAALTQRAAALTTETTALKQRQEQLAAQRASVDAEIRQRIELARIDVDKRKRLLALLDQERSSGPQPSYASAMQAFARQNPRGLWLTGFHLDKGLRGMELRGGALSGDLLPRYIQGLRREPVFAGNLIDQFRVQQPKTTAPSEQPASPAYVEFVLSNRPIAPAAGSGGGT